MGKLLGLPMGVDVCYTNHADADQNSADNLLILLAAAGVNFVIGVPCAGDVMLNHQSVSYHDAAGVRGLLGLSPAPEFRTWLEERGVLRGRRLGLPDGTMQKQLVREVEAILS
jgi:ethanolamine ammonia-lyase large subunit